VGIIKTLVSLPLKRFSGLPNSYAHMEVLLINKFCSFCMIGEPDNTTLNKTSPDNTSPSLYLAIKLNNVLISENNLLEGSYTPVKHN
jgi:hypothetical protein